MPGTGSRHEFGGPWLIDERMPVFDMSEYHEVRVEATAARAYEAVRRLDGARSGTAVVLLMVRTLIGLVSPRHTARSYGRLVRRPRLTLDDLVRSGFVVLGERPGQEILLGVVGQFWKPAGGLRRIEAAEFDAFDEPNHAKATWTFAVRADGPGSVISTETRILCTDPAARRAFRRYWRVVGPFSAFIRRRLLSLIKRDAERSSGETGTDPPVVEGHGHGPTEG